MAAILKLRRGTSASPALVDGELFLNYTTGTIQFRSGSVTSNLLPLDKTISGDIILNGDITASNIVLSGDLSAQDVRISGNIYLGDQIANDNINVQASFSGSLIPSASDEFSLGTETYKWKNLWVVSASIENVSLPGSGILSSSNENFTTFSSSVDLRLDNSEWTGSNHKNRLELLENFSSSEYQIDSSSFNSRITSLTNETGSYATTGSNIFIGNQTITGSIVGSGSVSFNSIPWPNIGSEFHLFKTDPYVGQFDSGNRNYGYLGVALEQISTGSWYENSLLIYTYDDHDNPTYGSELNVGPLRSHIRILPSGSGHYGNLSVEDTEGGTSRALIYADDIQIGFYTGSTVSIGNSNTTTTIRGNVNAYGNISSSGDISASLFYGDGRYLTNVTASYVEYDNVVNKPTLVSGSSQIDVNGTQNFTPFSSSVDSRLDEIEGPLSSSVNQQLTSIHAYTSSLKNSIDVNGSNLTVLGNLTVQGTQTSLNTTELLVEDILLALASGSTTSVEADGGGIFISGADASMTWNHANQLIEFNTKVSSSVGFKGDGSELTGVHADSVDVGDVIDFNSGVIGVLVQENVHSGSYLGTATTSDLDEGTRLYYTDTRVKTKLNTEGVVSGSSQISFNGITDVPSGLVSGSTQITNGSGLVSGSSQISFNGITDVPSGLVSGSTQITHGSGILSSSNEDFLTFSGSVDTRLVSLEGDQHTHTNKSFLDVIDQNLSETDTPTFPNISLSNLTLLGSGEFEAVFSGSAGTLGTRTLGTAAFFNVSASVGDDPNSIPTNKAVSDALIAAGAGDITAVNDSTLYTSDYLGLEHTGDGTLNGGYGQIGNVVIGLATGSVKFTEGVVNALPGGIVSSSVQTISHLNGTGIISSSEQIDSDLFNIDGLVSSSTQISAYNTFLEINGDGVISSSAQLTSEFDTRYLNTNSDGVVSGSSQIDLTQTTNFTSFSSSLDSRLDNQELFSSSINTTIKTKMNLDGVLSGSSQIIDGSGIVSSSEQISNYGVFAELNGDGLISGSGQLTDMTGDVTVNSSGVSAIGSGVIVNDDVNASAGIVYTKLNLNGSGIVSGSSQILAGSGIVSSSEQISNYNTFLEINGDSVVSSSAQIKNLGFVDLSSPQTISGTKTFNDIVVNGTGSFAYIQSTAGSAKIIGDAFVVVNTATPTSRYAGLQVYDSGSTLSTASFQFDGQTNDWHYEYSGSGGVDYAVAIFGPEYNTLGNPTYLTSNRIPKAVDNHHLNDSNITDSGTLITLGSAVDVSGVTNFNNTTQSTSKTTGAVIIDGGVGIAKTLNVGEDVVAYASSDRRLKDEITPIENPLQKINQIGGYSFVWNENQHIYSGKDYGVIAQEIEEILPELVETRENGYKAVKYDRLVSLLIEGVKELSKEISELKSRMEK